MHASIPPAILAPRLAWRRRVRHYAFPLAVAAFFLILAIIIWLPDRNRVWPFIWLALVWGCILVDDLTGRESLFLNGCYAVTARLGRVRSLRPDLSNARVVYNIYPEPRFYHNEQIQRLASLCLMSLIWGLAVALGWLLPLESDLHNAFVIWFLLLSGLLPFGITFLSPPAYSRTHGELTSWVLISLATLVAAASLYKLLGFGLTWLLTCAGFFLIYLTIYISQRMWGAERAVTAAMHRFSEKLLTNPRSLPKSFGDYSVVVDLIHTELRHERAYLLLPTSDGQSLTLVEARGEESVLGQTVPINGSISGRAYVDKRYVVWNDVKRCDYRVELGLQDTRSEIAVPAIHEGKAYAVINVQSTKRNIYEPDDVATVEIIARMLGAAMAVDERVKLYQKTEELWEILAMATRADVPTEERALELVVDCVGEALGGPTFIYYPLTLSGWPLKPPLVSGLESSRLPPVQLEFENDLTLELLGAWTHYELQTMESMDDAWPARLPRLAIDHGLRSLFFVPIGRRQEKLGGLFIGYQRRRQFDSLFRFTALSLAQALGELMAEIRYREIYSHGFGRPELALHTLIDRHRGKNATFHARADELLIGQEHERNCPLLPLIDRADDAFRALEKLESAAPPGFWETSLTAELHRFGKGLIGEGDKKPTLIQEIDPRIDLESPWIRLALYRLIVEATNNAIEHGKSDSATVRVRRAERTIEVEVTNRGRPPAPYTQPEHNPNGIYHLLDMCVTQLGARCVWPTHAAGVTRVAVSIPALPLLAPVERPRSYQK